jgi:hypothetical protein
MSRRSDEALARGAGLFLLLVALAACGWALTTRSVPDPPSYALGSDLIYRLERIAVIVLVAALPTLLIGQLLAGRFPKGFGRGGIRW